MPCPSQKTWYKNFNMNLGKSVILRRIRCKKRIIVWDPTELNFLSYVYNKYSNSEIRASSNLTTEFHYSNAFNYMNTPQTF
jgi:hypothetical protein